MKRKITPQELNERLEWSINDKLRHTIYVFLEYYMVNKGHVYLGLSGGKDSQTLEYIIDGIFKGKWKDYVSHALMEIKHEYNLELCEYDLVIIEKIYGGKPPNVFCDTGLEFPELRKHVKNFDNTIFLKPRMKFPDVIKHIGVAVGSKHIAQQVRRLKGYLENPSKKNEATRNLYLTGIKRDGTKSKMFGLGKWLKLLDAPFKVSDRCCDIFKKEPFERYKKETGRNGITGTTVTESMQRRSSYLSTGCNTFEKGKEMSRPISIWKDEDIWEFADQEGIRFCEVYYDREFTYVMETGEVVTVILEGEGRTGCMFCLFGVHLEKKNKLNRFQRLAISHPKQYLFMLNNCGLKVVFKFIGVNYKVDEKVLKIKTTEKIEGKQKRINFD